MAQPRPRFPQSYENVPVRKALTAIAAEPTLDNLDALLAAAVKGGLVVDVTGSTPQDTRLRTISSTTGEAVLPLFTSMNALRAAVAQTAEGEGAKVQAVIVPCQPNGCAVKKSVGSGTSRVTSAYARTRRFGFIRSGCG